MNQLLIDAVVRWTQHVAAHPEQLHAEVLTLRRPTGIQDVDAHRALLGDVLQGVHKLITEPLP